MAYTSSNKRTSYTTTSRGTHQVPVYSHAQEHQINDDQHPLYSNEPINSKDHRRTGGVSSKVTFDIFIDLLERFDIVFV